MKKFISYLSIGIMILLSVLNVIFVANIGESEKILITNNSLFYIIFLVIFSIGIYFLTEWIDKKISNRGEQFKKRIWIISEIFYFVLCVLLIVFLRPPIVGDQIHACNLAETFYTGNNEKYLPNTTYAGVSLFEYMQGYYQQITLAFMFSIFLKIIHFDGIGLLRILNILFSLIITIYTYKIAKQISGEKKDKYNIFRPMFIIFTFFSLFLLNTFIYGDIPSLALSLIAIYEAMQYKNDNKIIHIIFAGISMSLAYLFRMNSAIFVIAISIYLLLNLLYEIKEHNITLKEIIVKLLLVILFIAITLLPATLVKNYYIKKYNLDRSKQYPTISYFLIGMEESPRCEGWYNESIGEYALKNPEKASVEYKDRIKERLEYFKEHPKYALKFYGRKIISMWCENTYGSIRDNMEGTDKIDMTKLIVPLTLYQKAMLIFMFVYIIIIVIQNRNNLSLDIILLLTTFIGGFLFHVMWEAKSRYIIPYIVVLMPICSIKIKKLKIKPWSGSYRLIGNKYRIYKSIIFKT